MQITDLLKYQPADKVCLIYAQKELTFGQLDSKSTQMAKAATFIQKGDKVFLQERDPVKLLLCFFAIIKAGGICILASSKMPVSLANRLMKQYTVEWKVSYAKLQTQNSHDLPSICTDDIFLGALSSGSSTGIPKITMRDQKSWLAAFPWQSKIFNLSGQDNLYLAGELAYTANLNSCIHAFSLGATVIISKNRLPQTWLKEITDYQVSAIFMVPAHYNMLLRAADKINEHITSLVTCGAKINKRTAIQLHNYFPQAVITEYYGASELGHVSYAHLDDLLQKPKSVGKLFPAVKAQIVDGVIWVKSPYLVPAKRPRATCGDLGSIDADGYLTLYGRKSGTINIGGVKIQPEQVEFFLKENTYLADAAVFALPDKLRGQKLVVAAVPKADNLKAKDIFHFCQEKTGCLPNQVILLSSLPLNSNGKINKQKLQQIAGSKNHVRN